MLRKSLVVALGFLGLFLAGTIAGTQSASAHYACGPWNNWCGPKFWAYPGYHFGWVRPQLQEVGPHLFPQALEQG
jgi:hypothetical protein